MPSKKKKTKSRAIRRAANEAKAKEKKNGSEAVANSNVVEEQGTMLIEAQMQRLTIDGKSRLKMKSSATNNRNDSEFNGAWMQHLESSLRSGMRDDEDLFTMPTSSYRGECPICFLPHSLDPSKSRMMTCCSKVICHGCCITEQIHALEGSREYTCIFCREPVPETEEEADRQVMKRVKANDPVAMRAKGVTCYKKGNFEGAFIYYTKAAGLGDIDAHYKLSLLYRDGEGVEKDLKKEIHHLEEAAIGGHPDARFYLGGHEGRNGRIDRATKHFIIAAKLGCDESLGMLQHGLEFGHVSEEEYASTLRGYQAAVDATKNEFRDKADAFYKWDSEQRNNQAKAAATAKSGKRKGKGRKHGRK
jgi:hypothetical protein